jgi:uncharacterized protein (TIGR00725 family)
VKKFIVGVMGGAEGASEEVRKNAYELGRLIAQEGWVLLNGGRAAGVMEASAKGAKSAGGLTIGILPERDAEMASTYIDIPIVTGMGDGRNYLNILTSDVVIALPGKTGTISEIALALKNGKTVYLLNFDLGNLFIEYRMAGLLINLHKPSEVIEVIREKSLVLLA